MGTPVWRGFDFSWPTWVGLFLLLIFPTACHTRIHQGIAPSISPADNPAIDRHEAQERACYSQETYEPTYTVGTGSVLNLRDGGGLVFCDSAGNLIEELTAWNLGVTDIQVHTSGQAAFITYTVDGENRTTHGVRIDLGRMSSVWRSEEEEVYSFLTSTKRLELSTNLDSLIQEGSASDTIDFIREESPTSQRWFVLHWEWDGETYQPTLRPDMFSTYEEYLSYIAVATPLECLLQFIDALRQGDVARGLLYVVNEEVYQDAIYYGLDIDNRVYQIVPLSSNRFELLDGLATLIIETVSVGDRYQINAIYPSRADE